MSIFTTTFLGHQGWMFTSEHGGATARLLVDPLLVEPFGHGGHVGQVYPPRVLDLDAMPPIDAVFITHEHEDHFNIPSFNRLDRKIPILLSARSSEAARTILEEMGFGVRLVDAGDTIEIGSLALHLFHADHLTQDNWDEWDLLAFLVRDVHGHGSFFSEVDAATTDETYQELRRILPELGLWSTANNANNWSFLDLGLDDDEDSRSRLPGALAWFSAYLNQQRKILSLWKTPVATVMCGGGFAMEGDRAWMNGHAYPADSERFCRALAALLPAHRFLNAAPGQRLHLAHNQLTSVDERTEFLTTRPRSEWPDRDFKVEARRLADYSPASGRRRLTSAEFDELLAATGELGAHFFADNAFKAFHSLHRSEVNGFRVPAFAIALRGEDGVQTLAYQPSGCRFVPVACGAPLAEYLVGVELWATDLLALFRGELSATAVAFGATRSWCFDPRVAPSIFRFWALFHPLRRPAAFLRLYRALLAGEPAAVPRIRAPAVERVLASKRATDRPEDRAVIPALEAAIAAIKRSAGL